MLKITNNYQTMKAKRLLFLVMAICLASGVKAQFYDSADDIYFYVKEYQERDEYVSTSFTSGYYTGRRLKTKPEENKAHVLVFNFDGTKAAHLGRGWAGTTVSDVKSVLSGNPLYYEDLTENTEYYVKYDSSSSNEVIYKDGYGSNDTYIFSKDRNTLKLVQSIDNHSILTVYKRVDKSYFKIGRSRTPNSSLHE